MDEKYSFRSLKRVHYFHGKILSAEDFTDEQEYLLEKFRRHNRYLHGYGVVNGLEVFVSGNLSDGFKVVISPGYAIDPLGREIVIPALHQEAIALTEMEAYVCLHYRERETDPVSVVGKVGDDEELFEPGRIEEFFEISFETIHPCTEDGIQLARLKRKKVRWKLDKKFRRPRI
jgi:hypothetical protein